MAPRKKIGFPTKESVEDEWQRRATKAAIQAVRDLVKPGGAVPPGAPIGRLTDVELGWLVAAVMFAWIASRAEQATAEGLDTELAIRATGYAPDPCDAGAVQAILPELAETPGIDWSNSLATWPRERMIGFLLTALGLVRKALIARDLGGGTITRNSGAAVIARQANAAAGGPFNDAR